MMRWLTEVDRKVTLTFVKIGTGEVVTRRFAVKTKTSESAKSGGVPSAFKYNLKSRANVLLFDLVEMKAKAIYSKSITKIDSYEVTL